CGSTRGLTVRAVVEGGDVISPLEDQILGRTAAEDIVDPKTGKVMFPAGTLLQEEECVVVEKADVEAVKIRSVLTCECKNGVCAACYGRDLARGTRVNVGEAVG